MNDEDLDRELARLAGRLPDPAQESCGRIADRLGTAGNATDPLPAPGALAAALLAVIAGIAVLAAVPAGLAGIRALSGLQLTALEVALPLPMLVLARARARECVPGLALGLPAIGWQLAASSLPLLAFLFTLQDAGTASVLQGLRCLRAGLVVALPAALVLGYCLRRGCVLRRRTATILTGALGGLAGFGFLELHCGILERQHVLIWHTGVAGAAAGLSGLWASLRSARGT